MQNSYVKLRNELHPKNISKDDNLSSLKNLDASTKFDEVLFMNVQDTYSVSSDICLKYVVLDHCEQSKWDWIGLFCVGLLKPRDFLTYQYIKPGIKNELLSVTFPGETLSKDEEEYYVFAYVTGTGCVKGVSIPFQITRRNLNEKLIEVGDNIDGFCVLEMEANVLKNQVLSKDEEIQELRETIQKLTASEKEATEKAFRLQSNLDEQNATIVHLSKKHQDEIEKHKGEFAFLQDEMRNVLQSKEALHSECKCLEQTINDLKKDNVHLEHKIADQGKKIATLEETSSARSSCMLELQENIKELKETQQLANEKFHFQQVELQKKKKDLVTVKNQNEKLREASCALKSYIDDLYNYVNQEFDETLLNSEDFADKFLKDSLSESNCKEFSSSWESETEYWKSCCLDVKEKYQKLNKHYKQANSKLHESVERIKACRAEYLSLYNEYQKVTGVKTEQILQDTRLDHKNKDKLKRQVKRTLKIASENQEFKSNRRGSASKTQHNDDGKSQFPKATINTLKEGTSRSDKQSLEQNKNIQKNLEKCYEPLNVPGNGKKKPAVVQCQPVGNPPDLRMF